LRVCWSKIAPHYVYNLHSLDDALISATVAAIQI